MPTRFSDTALKSTEPDDFIVRRRRPLVSQLFIVFAIAFAAIYLTATVMNETGSRTAFFLTLFTIIGALCWCTILFAMRNRDLVLATEFLNALLASATQLSSRFCLIARNDGSIIYNDPGFQKFFPRFMQGEGQNVGGLLAGAGVPAEQATHIVNIIEQNKSARVIMPLKDANNRETPTILTIDPLPRPKGYLLLRGREYIQKRSGSDTPPDSSSALLLAQAIYTLTQGILIADGAGAVTYVNQALENWLGYASGEILNGSMTLDQIFYQYRKGAPGRPILDDYEGPVTCTRKDGAKVEMALRQHLLHEGAKLLGISAVIVPPLTADVKKN